MAWPFILALLFISDELGLTQITCSRDKNLGRRGREEKGERNTRLTHTDGREVDIDILPSIGRHRERLVHDADVIVLLDDVVPPIPAGAVRVTERERVQVLNGSPVRDGNQRVTSTILGCSEAGGFPQVY